MCLGTPGRIIEIHTTNDLVMGKIDFNGITREVCLSLVPTAQVGDYVLIHVGFAINIICQEEAVETLRILQEINETEFIVRGSASSEFKGDPR